MNRLTARTTNGHAYYPECFKAPCNGDGCKKEMCDFSIEICSKLADYEDTGLTPEQIGQLQEMHMEKCGELAEEKKKHEWIPADNPPKTFNDRGQSEDVLLKLKWFDGDISYCVGWYSKSVGWTDDSENTEVIAWMPLTSPYIQEETK